MPTELAPNASASASAIAIVGATTNSALEVLDLPQNYSLLLNKLEQLALGLDSAFSNLSLDRRDMEVAVGPGEHTITTTAGVYRSLFDGADDQEGQQLLGGGPFASGRAPPPRPAQISQLMNELEYSRVVSDIWIGVILTLLITSVVFFICSCFLYHKFQQWKNSYHANPNEPVEVCRRYNHDYEVESLPSYTIVSGLPTYDDALEEFRKAGVILGPSSMMPVVKIFEKDGSHDNFGSSLNLDADAAGGDNISVSSVCTCGAASPANAAAAANSATATPHNSFANLSPVGNANGTQVIELSPEQLETLSRKRLSLQIAFNQSIRRQSRPRVDLYREVMHRNNMLRTRPGSSVRLANNVINGGAGGGAGAGAGGGAAYPQFDVLAAGAYLNAGTGGFPPIHRSSSSASLSAANEQRAHMQRMQHRGSLC